LVEHQLPKLRVAGSIPVVRFPRYFGQASASLRRVSTRCSGSTLTSASTEHRHEVRIASPAWDEVQVDVVCDACTCNAAEIPAEVVALRPVDLRERAHALRRETMRLQGLFVVELGKVSDVARRGDHQVSRCVRELVEQHKRFPASVNDEAVIVRGRCCEAEDTPFLLVRAAHVLEPPRGPQLSGHREASIRPGI
jgi:hypothetical protein